MTLTMRNVLIALALAGALVGGLWHQGLLPVGHPPAGVAAPAKPAPAARPESAPAVTTVRAQAATLKEAVLITGTLVPRLEVLVAPEVEGLRVLELLADEGDRIAKGQVLARLEQETLRVQLAQNDAALAKTDAAIAQARSAITAAEAREMEAGQALDRAKPLRKSGVVSESVLEQRESAALTAVANLRSARDGLTLSEAERAQMAAQRRDIQWKLGKTEIRAPVDGIVSRRSARMGAVASASPMAEPMFRLIAEGQVELEADVPEVDMARLVHGQPATVTVAGVGEVSGAVRLVAPEVDRSTRLGRVRVSLGDNPALRIGSFARGSVSTRSSRGLAVPLSAVMFGTGGAAVQLVVDGRVTTRKVSTGLLSGELIEITSGISDGDVVVAKAGTFLRSGDRVTPVSGEPTASIR